MIPKEDASHHVKDGMTVTITMNDGNKVVLIRNGRYIPEDLQGLNPPQKHSK